MSHHKGVLELWLKFGGDIVVPMGGGYVYILYVWGNVWEIATICAATLRQPERGVPRAPLGVRRTRPPQYAPGPGPERARWSHSRL